MQPQGNSQPASDDLYRTSVMVSRKDMRKLRIVQAVEDKDRDQVIRELIAARVEKVELQAAA